jgi:8-oxo-dGTP pyrophosphatase MutT (NUDIX family)
MVGGSAGFTIELCAGLIDKAKSLKEIVSEEIMEEVGYRVDPNDVHELSAAVAAAGVNGSTSHQFYATVSKECRQRAGMFVGLEGAAVYIGKCGNNHKEVVQVDLGEGRGGATSTLRTYTDCWQ